MTETGITAHEVFGGSDIDLLTQAVKSVSIKVAQHRHDGRDSAEIPSQSLPNQDINNLKTVALSTANITGMFTSPVRLIDAPGPNIAIVLESAVLRFNVGGTQFTGGGVIRIQYNGTAVNILASTIPATVITAASSSTTAVTANTVANGITVPTNTSIEMVNASGAFATGNGTAKVYLKYYIISL